LTSRFAGIRILSTRTEIPSGAEEVIIFHQLVLAAYSQPEAAGFILRGIKGIFVAIGSIIAAIICAAIAAMKGRNPFGWGILGLFFSILTLIVVIVIPSKKG
jgi:hypothetical protein